MKITLSNYFEINCTSILKYQNYNTRIFLDNSALSAYRNNDGILAVHLGSLQANRLYF